MKPSLISALQKLVETNIKYLYSAECEKTNEPYTYYCSIRFPLTTSSTEKRYWIKSIMKKLVEEGYECEKVQVPLEPNTHYQILYWIPEAIKETPIIVKKGDVIKFRDLSAETYSGKIVRYPSNEAIHVQVGEDIDNIFVIKKSQIYANG